MTVQLRQKIYLICATKDRSNTSMPITKNLVIQKLR